MTAQAEAHMLDAFSKALRAGQLAMQFQPKVRLADGTLASVEALVRWEDPELGQVDPATFVALAEQHGLIDELTDWGLRTTLQQWLKWKAEELTTRVAFNISAISLQRLDFPDVVEAMCAKLGVPADCLVLELTEGATQPLIKLMDTLTRFRIKGIGLAIDDFGTGYSSLMQLRQLPFTDVKIDRSFVADVPSSRDATLIIETIIRLAHGLGLTATAEGIETRSQLHLLRELNCDMAQGYLIAPPLDPDRLKPWCDEFAARWPELVQGPTHGLSGRHVEADALR